MKKTGLSALVLAASLAFTGCSVSLSSDVDKLLRAPQHSGETGAIQNTLDSYLGENAQLKYPTSGEYLSPFLFGDWNGDGREDAAVLYTCKAKGQNVCLSILERINGAWAVTQEVEGLATEVESISFAAMDSSPSTQLLVGYGSAQSGRYLSVYSYQNRTLDTVLQQGYSQWLLDDITGDHFDDLVVVSPVDEEQAAIQLSLLTNEDGSFHLTQQFTVGQGVYTGYANLCAGHGRNGQPYLVMDGRVGGYLASTILIYDSVGGQLQEYLPPGYVELYSATVRYNSALTSRDMDGNGTIDIPRQTSEGGEIALPMEHRLGFVNWYDYTDGRTGHSHFGILDSEYDFYLPLPEAWRDRVQLDANNAGDGWVVRDLEEGRDLVEVRVADLKITYATGYTRVGIIGRQQVSVRINSAEELSVEQVKEGFLVL